jgi:uncharacterized protein
MCGEVRSESDHGGRPVEGIKAVRDFLTALALMLAIEGLCFAAFPEGMRKALQDASEMPAKLLRALGIIGAVVGVLLVWVSKGFPAFNLL